MSDIEKSKTSFYKEIKKVLKEFYSSNGDMSVSECFEKIVKIADEVFD